MIYNIILWASIGVLLQDAEPIIMIKRYIGFKEEDYDHYSKEKRYIHRLIYCALCLTFWITLLGTFNLELAVISSVLAAAIQKIIR